MSEKINDQKTHQARRVLEGIQHGTILGFSFLKVCQDLGVPPKALTRFGALDSLKKGTREINPPCQLRYDAPLSIYLVLASWSVDLP